MQRLSRPGAFLPAIAFTVLAACQGDTSQSPETAAPVPSAKTVADLALVPFHLGRLRDRAPGQACQAPGFRQFDFWLGAWSIEDFSAGEAADGGDDIITSELGGCAVFENYGADGFRGRSMNTFDPTTGQWHQHWSDNSSLVLDLAGGFAGGHMVLEGDRPTLAGGRIHDRIDWTALAPDEVRQFWQFSVDGGPDQVQFDGHYHRQAGVTLDPEIPTTICQDPAFPAPRQFDFTLGRWKVALDGPLGRGGDEDLRSTITTDLSGCLVEERLTGEHGYEARVFSSARRRSGQWYRTFVDNRGLRVFLTGREEAGRLVLTGTLPAGGSAAADVRAGWDQLSGGRFRERWEISRDGGATWHRLLDATYRPR
jgi:hypothetical protein